MMIAAGLLFALLAPGAAVRTGPAVGSGIPAFELRDQNGVARNFANLRGPKGLMLVFMRSADW
jgi:hypothetical protein